MFFKKSLAIGLLCLISSVCWSQSQTITILSYNIYHGEDPYQPNRPNLDQVISLIKQLDPDIVAFQEVDSMTTRTARVYGEKVDLVKEIGKQTDMAAYFAKAMDYADGGYGEGLLVKGSPTFSSQLLPTPVGGEPRSVAWAETADQILIGGTHLCHQFEENRKAQVKAIDEAIQKQQKPVIWMGDLNFGPNDPEYALIKDAYTDAAVAAKNEQPTYRSETFADRIDYVWYSSKDFKLVSYEVLDVPYSDHFPVLVTLEKLKP